MTPPITPENVTHAALDNGVVVLIKENHTNASVSMHGRVRAGAMYETDRTCGLAQFTATSLQRGTDKYSFRKLNEIYDSVGMSFSLGTGTETTGFSGKSLVEDFDRLLKVAAQVLLHPTFPAVEVEKLRGQFLTGLREAKQDTRWVAFKHFRELCYPPGHPFHRLPDGTEEALKSFKRTSLDKFHARFYRPEGSIVVVVGDVDAQDALEKIHKYLSAWKGKGRAPEFDIPPAPDLPASRREDIAISGKTQSDIVLGFPGIKRSDPDFYALRVGDLVFGQLGLMGRLGEVVRDQLGLAYYVYSGFDAGIGAGPWAVSAGVNPQSVTRAVEAIGEQFQRLRQAGISEDELRHAQDFLTGSLALRLETNDGVAATLADIELYGLGLDYIERYPGLIRGLTAEDIRAAVDRHAHLESAVTVVAGPPSSAAGV